MSHPIPLRVAHLAPKDRVMVHFNGESYRGIVVEAARGKDQWRVKNAETGKIETVHGGFIQRIGMPEKVNE